MDYVLVPVDFPPVIQIFEAQKIKTMLADFLCRADDRFNLLRHSFLQEVDSGRDVLTSKEKMRPLVRALGDFVSHRIDTASRQQISSMLVQLLPRAVYHLGARHRRHAIENTHPSLLCWFLSHALSFFALVRYPDFHISATCKIVSSPGSTGARYVSYLAGLW